MVKLLITIKTAYRIPVPTENKKWDVKVSIVTYYIIYVCKK